MKRKKTSYEGTNKVLDLGPQATAEDVAQQKTINEKPQATTETKSIGRRDLVVSIVAAYGAEGKEELENEVKTNVRLYLTQIIKKHSVAAKYNVVFLYDKMKMVQSDADTLYAAVTKFTESKPILLILHSSGGYVEPAYLIGKLLHEYSGGKLDVAVPRRAKSGATLLCCAADHIHMGSLSELGPIDPQIEGLPALGLKSAIQHIAALTAEYPHATELLAQYMSKTIRPIHLGYYERVALSAVQYAERLLKPHILDLGQSPEKIAKDLVYSYNDHGFVIDKQEAQRIFGDKIVMHNTDEYQLANELYQAFVFIANFADMVDRNFYMIGSLTTESGFAKKTK